MREIKFRAFGKDRMEYSGEMDMGAFMSMYYDNKLGELMQYTGLKDKNGKEIYEGDILKTQYTVDIVKEFKREQIDDIGMVEYNDGCYWFSKYPSDQWIKLINRSMAKVEVIGNIYENPELIKEHD